MSPRKGIAGVRLCHAAPCKYPAGRCPLHGLRVAFPGEGRLLTHERPIIEDAVKAVRHHYPDAAAFSCCGHSICSCPQKAPEPPKDVLPEGWRRSGGFFSHQLDYTHESGANVWRAGPETGWGFLSACGQAEVSCYEAEAPVTRDLAMAAALQSVEPELDSPPFTPAALTEFAGRDYQRQNRHAEPAVRDGWVKVPGDSVSSRHNNETINASVWLTIAGTWVAAAWGKRAESGHPTIEAALIRAEQLARGEPDDRDEPDGPDGYESAGAEFVANGGWSGL